MSTWEPFDALRLTAGLVAQRIRTRPDPSSRDLSAATGLATSDPSNYWTLQASWDIARGQTVDLFLRHYGKLDRPAVPGYESLDITYNWRVSPGLDLSIRGRNLLASSHAEFNASPSRSMYERNIGVNLVWRP